MPLFRLYSFFTKYFFSAKNCRPEQDLNCDMTVWKASILTTRQLPLPSPASSGFAFEKLLMRSCNPSLMENSLNQTNERKNGWLAVDGSCPVWPDDGIKIAKMFYKSCPKIATVLFCLKVMFFKVAQKLAKIFAYFCKKYCHQDLSKISQSSHTVLVQTVWLEIVMTHSTNIYFCTAASSVTSTDSVTRCWKKSSQILRKWPKK